MTHMTKRKIVTDKYDKNDHNLYMMTMTMIDSTKVTIWFSFRHFILDISLFSSIIYISTVVLFLHKEKESKALGVNMIILCHRRRDQARPRSRAKNDLVVVEDGSFVCIHVCPCVCVCICVMNKMLPEVSSILLWMKHFHMIILFDSSTEYCLSTLDHWTLQLGYCGHWNKVSISCCASD